MPGARLVLRLFLPALVANNALVGFAGARRVRLRHARFEAVPAALIAGRPFFGMMQLFPAFPDQQLVTDHLPDDLLGLRLGFFPELAHGGLLSGKNGLEAAMFPIPDIKDRRIRQVPSHL